MAASGASSFGPAPAAVDAARPLRGAAGPDPGTIPFLSAAAADEQLRRAVDRLAAGLSAEAAARLRGTAVLIGRIGGPGLAAYSVMAGLPAGVPTVLLDADGAGLCWQAGPGYRDSLYPGGAGTGTAAGTYDLLTAYGYALGRRLGAGPVTTGSGTLSDDLLPPGVRRLLPGRSLEQLYGTDPADWMFA